MAFKMGVSKEAVEGFELIQPGVYEVRFLKFKPKWAKEKEGKERTVNLNAQMEPIGNPDLANRILFDTLNQNTFYMADFCHAFGVPLEQVGDDYQIPGEWDGDPKNPETWTYRGPLTGKVAKVEVTVDTFNNKQNNKISRYFCQFGDECATRFPQVRHSDNLVKKSGANT